MSETPSKPHVPSRVLTLVEALRHHARSLPQAAHEVAAMLDLYASEIQAPSTSDQALVRFERFAFHFKGLRDIIVPGRTENEWLVTVKELRGLSRSAVRFRGLDPSLLGRLQHFFVSRSAR
jgi:hypothetical protein